MSETLRVPDPELLMERHVAPEFPEPHFAPGMVGRMAVMHTIAEAHAAVSEREYPSWEAKGRGREIASARKRLASLGEYANELFYSSIVSHHPSKWMREAVGLPTVVSDDPEIRQEQINNFFQILTEKKPGSSRYEVPNRTFVNFLEWYNYASVRDQGRSEEEMVPEVAREIVEATGPNETVIYEGHGGRTVEDPDGNRFVIEKDGSRWVAYSARGGLSYMGPDDLVGYYEV